MFLRTWRQVKSLQLGKKVGPIAERTRAKAKTQNDVESEIPFEILQDDHITKDKVLEEKEECGRRRLLNPRYRKFIQGVIHNESNLDAEDGDDEDYVPDPSDEVREKVCHSSAVLCRHTSLAFRKQK